MERILVSINTALGTLLVVLALVYPWLDQALISGAKTAVVEEYVSRIMQEERAYFQANTQFILFGSGDPAKFPNHTVTLSEAERETGFVFDAYREQDGTLVVRAMPSEQGLRSGSVQPKMYVIKYDPFSNKEEKSWS